MKWGHLSLASTLNQSHPLTSSERQILWSQPNRSLHPQLTSEQMRHSFLEMLPSYHTASPSKMPQPKIKIGQNSFFLDLLHMASNQPQHLRTSEFSRCNAVLFPPTYSKVLSVKAVRRTGIGTSVYTMPHQHSLASQLRRFCAPRNPSAQLRCKIQTYAKAQCVEFTTRQGSGVGRICDCI